MPIIDAAVEEVFLDAILSGDTTNLPTTWEIALLTEQPSEGSVVELADVTEVDDGLGGTEFLPNGYERQTITTATDWAPAADRQKTTLAPVQFPDVPDFGYPDTITHWAAYSPELDAWGFYAPVFTEDGAALEVGESDFGSPGPSISLTVIFADAVSPTEE